MRLITALSTLALSTTALTQAAQAEAPRVVTDVRPVHSIVAAVMQGVGEPTLLLEGDEDPHSFALRPSQVRSLANAQLVVWMGEGMTPWLEGGLEVAREAVSLELLELEELEELPLVLEPGEEHHDDHGDDDHAEHDNHGHDDDHDDHERDEDHAEHDDHHGHDHGDTDPHAWLDPLNAARYAAEIGAALSQIDPENAEAYSANAEAAAARYTALAEEISGQLGAEYDATVLVYHDAYRYFFTRFEIPLAATIADLHGITPSAAQIAELRAEFGDAGAVCLLTELTADPRVIQTVLPDAQTYLADQLGRSFEPGPELYEALLRDIAGTLLACQS